MKRRFFFVLHSWVGVTTGLLLFLVCWSGSFAVLANEADWLLNPGLRAPATGQPASWERLATAAKAADPAGHLSMLRGPRGPGWAAEAWLDASSGQLQRLYIDPASGRVLARTSFFNVQRFFRDFHMRLMWPDTGPWGYYAVSILSLVLITQVVTSLIHYRRWWTRLFQLRWNRGAPALTTDLHRLSGLWSLLFTPILALTGLWYLVERIDANHLHVLPTAPPAAQVSPGKSTQPLDMLVAAAHRAQPNLRITMIYFPNGGGSPIAFVGQDGSFLVRDAAARVELDPANGQLASSQRPADLGPVRYWAEMADRIHFGDWGGLASRLLWFAFGLMLSLLCLTGAILHVQRDGMDHGLARGPAVITAHAITLGLLVLTVYGGWNEIRDYGDRTSWPVVPVPVILFLSAWVLSAVAALQWWVRKVR